jgi:hypothetical protein
MAAYRLARRERPKRANAALQPLKREPTLPCGLRLALARLGRSELHQNLPVGVLKYAGAGAFLSRIVARTNRDSKSVISVALSVRAGSDRIETVRAPSKGD